MKIFQNRLLILIYLLLSSFLFSSTIEINGYKLDIKENSGRFEFFMKNEKGDYIPVFSNEDSRTSKFDIYENKGFYTLGDTFRYRGDYLETSDGGIFIWRSKDLLIKQALTLDGGGFLRIDFLITNISSRPKSVGMKYLMDTTFEKEDYFYLEQSHRTMEIRSEYEIEDPHNVQYWTSGVKNSTGASLMMIPTEHSVSRIIFGNWERLDNADYDYRTAFGREFNNPPYSINDSAVLYLFSPSHVVPQKSIEFSLCLRAIKTVEQYSDIEFKERVIVKESEPERLHAAAKNEVTHETIHFVEKARETVPDALSVNEEKSHHTNLPEVVAEPVIKVEAEISTPEKVLETHKLVEKQLIVISEIRKIIETLSKPGIIDQYNLSLLEELINKLEEPDLNEN